MIKKIEQYLLTKYPILWNLKLAPVALLVIAVMILLFTIGYGITDTSVDSHSFFSGSYTLTYAGSILIAILIFIFWIIQYNRNNGLKAHYPQSNISLFAEWLLIFAICSFICFIPNALSLGKERKWKNAVTEQQYTKAMQTLTRIRALLPSDEYYFEIRGQRPLLVGDANVDRTKFDTKLYTYEEDAIEPNNPIEYVGPSLLYYKDNASYYLTDGWEDQVDLVQQWLITEKRDSIEATIQAFLDLHKQHGGKTNVDVNSWMDIIYHPPLYPLPEQEMISENDYSTFNHLTQNYTKYSNLSSYYIDAGENYEDNSFNRWFILITLIVGMGLSVMVFSARVTSGRSWIFALLSCGVISFIMSLLSGIFALIGFGNFAGILIPILWLALLAIIGFVIILKVANGKKKGRSNIYINLGLWLIPTIVPLCYLIFIYIQDLVKDFSGNVGIREDSSTIFYNLFSVNIVFTIIVMFPVVMLIRKWKALPED